MIVLHMFIVTLYFDNNPHFIEKLAAQCFWLGTCVPSTLTYVAYFRIHRFTINSGVGVYRRIRDFHYNSRLMPYWITQRAGRLHKATCPTRHR